MKATFIIILNKRLTFKRLLMNFYKKKLISEGTLKLYQIPTFCDVMNLI